MLHSTMSLTGTAFMKARQESNKPILFNSFLTTASQPRSLENRPSSSLLLCYLSGSYPFLLRHILHSLARIPVAGLKLAFNKRRRRRGSALVSTIFLGEKTDVQKIVSCLHVHAGLEFHVRAATGIIWHTYVTYLYANIP